MTLGVTARVRIAPTWTVPSAGQAHGQPHSVGAQPLWAARPGQCKSGGSCARRGRDAGQARGSRAAAWATEPTDSARLHRVLGQGRRAHAPRVRLRHGWAFARKASPGLLLSSAASMRCCGACCALGRIRAPYEYFRKQGTFTRDAGPRRHHAVTSRRLSYLLCFVAVLLALRLVALVGSGPCIRPVLRAGQPAAPAPSYRRSGVVRLPAFAVIHQRQLLPFWFGGRPASLHNPLVIFSHPAS